MIRTEPTEAHDICGLTKDEAMTEESSQAELTMELAAQPESQSALSRVHRTEQKTCTGSSSCRYSVGQL